MNWRAAGNQRKGLDFEPCGLIGAGGSLEYQMMNQN